MEFRFETEITEETANSLRGIDNSPPVIGFSEIQEQKPTSAEETLEGERELRDMSEHEHLGTVSLDYDEGDVERLNSVKNALDQDHGTFSYFFLDTPYLPDIDVLREEGYSVPDVIGIDAETKIRDTLEEQGFDELTNKEDVKEYLSLVERSEPVIGLKAYVSGLNEYMYLRGDTLFIREAETNPRLALYRKEVESALEETGVESETVGYILDKKSRISDSSWYSEDR